MEYGKLEVVLFLFRCFKHLEHLRRILVFVRFFLDDLILTGSFRFDFFIFIIIAIVEHRSHNLTMNVKHSSCQVISLFLIFMIMIGFEIVLVLVTSLWVRLGFKEVILRVRERDVTLLHPGLIKPRAMLSLLNGRLPLRHYHKWLTMAAHHRHNLLFAALNRRVAGISLRVR